MRKLLLLLCATVWVSSMTFAEEAPAAPGHDGSVTHTFKFHPSDDAFYRLVGNNHSELERLYKFVDLHKTAIRNGEAPVYVHSYSSSLPTRQENLQSAKIRANRVKSDLIVKKGLREADFRTKNSANSHGRHKSAVVVTISVPQKHVAVTPQPPQKDRYEELHNANVDRITALQRKIDEQANRIQVLESRPAVTHETKVIERIEAPQTKGWREPYSFALRTNFLYWAALLPNIGIEWRALPWLGIKVDGHYSNWKLDHHRTHKMWMVSPEIRFYVGEEKRIYLGLGGNYAAGIDMSWRPYSMLHNPDHGYKGSFYNGGLVLGYQARLSRRLSFDFNLGFGLTRYKYDTYALTPSGREDNLRTKQTKNRWGITQAGATLVWRFGRKHYYD